jgi:hypothetical protein
MVEEQILTPTTASSWKGKLEVEGTPLRLPSENVALARQMSPSVFMTSGMIPDPLTGIIKKAIASNQGLPPSASKEIMDDPKLIGAALELFDRTLCHVIIEPVIQMPPPCDVEINGKPCGEYSNKPVHENPAASGKHQYHEGPRDPNILYADQVDMNDKMFIFNWCLGGTRDLETFREELERGLGTLSDGEDVHRPAKRTTRRKR